MQKLEVQHRTQPRPANRDTEPQRGCREGGKPSRDVSEGESVENFVW